MISCYRPKAGKDQQLDELMKTHIDILRSEGLATARKSIMMKAADGTIIEVFEWKSKEAIEKAHTNPKVLKMWEEFSQVCDFVKPVDISEFQNIFSEFEPVN